MQTRQPVAHLDIAERPRLERRLLNHWDNLDGSIERGYAGRSLWWPDRVDQRVQDYARANASIGINGAVINSVNANPQSLTAPLLGRRRTSREILRPYRIRVYLAANFAAPKMIGGLSTDDPLDASVARWWRAKADEIYRLIPDFGGFVVKANSEGQPGPQDYGRTHADGANVLADALAPHGGIVMWRAFVYDADVDPDRVKRAYTGVRASRREVSRQRLRPGQERPARFPAARAVSSAVRRDAEDAVDGGAADHAGIPWPVQPSRVPRADVEGVPRRRHVRERRRFPGGEGDWRVAHQRELASPGWPTRDATSTGAATISRKPTGTPSAGWPGIPG